MKRFTLAEATAFIATGGNPHALFVLQSGASPESRYDTIYCIMDYTYSSESRAAIGYYNQTSGVLVDCDGTAIDQRYYDTVMELAKLKGD